MISKETENILTTSRELWNNNFSVDCTEIVWRKIKGLDESGKIPEDDLKKFLSTLPFFEERFSVLADVLRKRNIISLPLPTGDRVLLRRTRNTDNGWS